MPRRKRQHSDTSSDSEGEYVPQNSTGRRSKPNIARKSSKRLATNAGDTEPLGPEDTSSSSKARPHSRTLHTISSSNDIRHALTAWYDGVRDTRGMPWRKQYDASLGLEERAQRAYEVWISEIMLQQTQVATVIPYYNRWMQRFPTIKDLAASDIDTVNSLWTGLGYYSRAARLLAGAKKAVSELDGRLPDNAKDMESKIPGIGRYSAGAICSIAYNEKVPVLDGNVNRLLSRVLALHAPPKSKATLDLLWAGAEAMVRGALCPGDVNQALIELGSTVCKPRNPTCGDCPVQTWCTAYQAANKVPDASTLDIEDLCTLCEPVLSWGQDQLGPDVTSYPMKVERKKQREEQDIVNVVEWRNKHSRFFLLIRRPEGGLLGGLHEFPTLSNIDTGMSPSEIKDVPARLLATLLKTPPPSLAEAVVAPFDPVTSKIVQITPAGDVVHIFSHIRKTYRVQWVILQGGKSTPPELEERLPVPVEGLSKKNLRKPKATTKSSSSKEYVASRLDGAQEQKGGDGEKSVMAMWVPLEDVEGSNIGTGVLKIWKLVSSLWSDMDN